MAAADMRCANPASLFLVASDILDLHVLVTPLCEEASVTAGTCFEGVCGDGMVPVAPMSVSDSSSVEARPLDELPSFVLRLASGVLCSLSGVVSCCDSLSSSGGHVAWTTEIAVGGETSSVSSLGVGIVYKRKRLSTGHVKEETH